MTLVSSDLNKAGVSRIIEMLMLRKVKRGFLASVIANFAIRTYLAEYRQTQERNAVRKYISSEIKWARRPLDFVKVNQID